MSDVIADLTDRFDPCEPPCPECGAPGPADGLVLVSRADLKEAAHLLGGTGKIGDRITRAYTLSGRFARIVGGR